MMIRDASAPAECFFLLALIVAARWRIFFSAC